MAKKLTKQINAQFSPSYMGNIPMYGFGSWLKDNKDTFAKVGGALMSTAGGILTATGVGAPVGAALMGAGSLVGKVGDGWEKQEQLENQTSEQQQQLNNQQLLKSINQQPQYSYANGGMLNSYAGGGNITGRITSVDNGGLHSENGGVKLGPSAMIERDEVVFKTKGGKKYIFSNRY